MFAFWSTPPLVAQGIFLPNGGAVNGNLAGTSTAVGCDAVGALFWNPAAMSGLRTNDVTIGSNLLFPHVGVTGTLPAGALGPFGPAVTQSGRTNSDNGVVPTTALAFAFREEGSKLSYGLSMSTIAAGGVNFRGAAVQLLGTNTTLDSRYDAIVLGINIKFGGSCSRQACPCADCSESPMPMPVAPIEADHLPTKQ
jgi:long-subunit fatty acid transport protein